MGNEGLLRVVWRDDRASVSSPRSDGTFDNLRARVAILQEARSTHSHSLVYRVQRQEYTQCKIIVSHKEGKMADCQRKTVLPLSHTPLLNNLTMPSRPRTTPGSYGCKRLNNQCWGKTIHLEDQTMFKMFCGRQYHCCVHHGIDFSKTAKQGVHCSVCLKAEEM